MIVDTKDTSPLKMACPRMKSCPILDNVGLTDKRQHNCPVSSLSDDVQFMNYFRKYADVTIRDRGMSNFRYVGLSHALVIARFNH